MGHVYSNFKKRNLPYAKVGRRVFRDLYSAEEYCSENGLDMNSAIQYQEGEEFEANIKEIAQYQKAILREVLKRMKARGLSLTADAEQASENMRTCDPSFQGFFESRMNEAKGALNENYEAHKVVYEVLEELERMTGWRD